MIIKSNAIKNNYLDLKYGGHDSENRIEGIPSCSFPFEIQDVPEGTKTFAWVLYDIDAYEVTHGFPWIHWVACNYDNSNVIENISRLSEKLVQGVNSWHSPLGGNLDKAHSSFYGGPTPPNKDHNYTLLVYALDVSLELEQGFYLNNMLKAMEGHILAHANLNVMYRVIN